MAILIHLLDRLAAILFLRFIELNIRYTNGEDLFFGST